MTCPGSFKSYFTQDIKKTPCNVEGRIMWTRGQNTQWGDTGQKWVKAEGNKMHSLVQGSPAHPAQGHSTVREHWSLCVYHRYMSGYQRIAVKSTFHGLLWKKKICSPNFKLSSCQAPEWQGWTPAPGILFASPHRGWHWVVRPFCI